MTTFRRVINVILVFSCIGIVIAGYIAWSAYKQYTSPDVIFSMSDPKGDDYGSGKYSYPTDTIFDPRKELLDLTKFTAFSYRDQYVFDSEMRLITNPWGAVEGFSHQIIEIYISDSSLSSGATEPLIQGSNILFDSRSPWNHLVKVVGFEKTAVYNSKDGPEQVGKTEGVLAGVLKDHKTIRVAVPKKLLPGDPKRWKYYVLVGSLDGAGPDNFRKVDANVSRWNFGGGTDTDFDPNVIDMLASEERQETMLSSYDVKNGRLAVIEPVRPVLNEYTDWEKFLFWVIDKYSISSK